MRKWQLTKLARIWVTKRIFNLPPLCPFLFGWKLCALDRSMSRSSSTISPSTRRTLAPKDEEARLRPPNMVRVESMWSRCVNVNVRHVERRTKSTEIISQRLIQPMLSFVFPFVYRLGSIYIHCRVESSEYLIDRTREKKRWRKLQYSQSHTIARARLSSSLDYERPKYPPGECDWTLLGISAPRFCFVSSSCDVLLGVYAVMQISLIINLSISPSLVLAHLHRPQMFRFPSAPRYY